MRYDNMSAFIVMDIVREAAKYPNAIHFEIGQPDLPPSDKVKAALQDAVQHKALGFWRYEKKSPRIMTALIR